MSAYFKATWIALIYLISDLATRQTICFMKFTGVFYCLFASFLVHNNILLQCNFHFLKTQPNAKDDKMLPLICEKNDAEISLQQYSL